MSVGYPRTKDAQCLAMVVYTCLCPSVALQMGARVWDDRVLVPHQSKVPKLIKGEAVLVNVQPS